MTLAIGVCGYRGFIIWSAVREGSRYGMYHHPDGIYGVPGFLLSRCDRRVGRGGDDTLSRVIARECDEEIINEILRPEGLPLVTPLCCVQDDTICAISL